MLICTECVSLDGNRKFHDKTKQNQTKRNGVIHSFMLCRHSIAKYKPLFTVYKHFQKPKQNRQQPSKNISDQKKENTNKTKQNKSRTEKCTEGQTDGQTDRDRTKQEYWLRKLAIKVYNIPQPTQGGALQHCHQLCRVEDAQVQWVYICIHWTTSEIPKSKCSFGKLRWINHLELSPYTHTFPLIYSPF